MKVKIFLFLIISGVFFVLFSSVFAHPGDVDIYNCHICYTNCFDWGLYTGQYHCHPYYGLYPECEAIFDQAIPLPIIEGQYKKCVQDKTRKEELRQLQQQQDEYKKQIQEQEDLLNTIQEYDKQAKKQDEQLINIVTEYQNQIQQNFDNYLQNLNNQNNIISCPANSYYSNGQCSCNAGYTYYNNKCMTYTESCKIVNNNTDNIVGVVGNDGKIKCNCSHGFIYNGSKCIVYVAPTPVLKKLEPVLETPKKTTKQKIIMKDLEIKNATSSSATSSVKEISAINTSTTTPTLTAAIIAATNETPKTPWYKKIWNFILNLF